VIRTESAVECVTASGCPCWLLAVRVRHLLLSGGSGQLKCATRYGALATLVFAASVQVTIAQFRDKLVFAASV
jgi:hypothetical protein